MHSTASDGRLSPSEVMSRAKKGGLNLVSLTDHDTVSGMAEARDAAGKLGMQFVPGTEISTRERGREVHLLAYAFDADHPSLQALLDSQQERRNTRALDFMDRFRREGLIPSDAELPPAPEGRSWARPHLGAVLMEHGAATSMEDAFSRFLSPGCRLFVEKPMPDGAEVMAAVHAAGGLVFLAHPGHHVAHAIVRSLVDAGLDGIEVVHPAHDAMLQRYYREQAARFGLLMSGGSDFHGRARDEARLGQRWFEPDESLLSALRTH